MDTLRIYKKVDIHEAPWFDRIDKPELLCDFSKEETNFNTIVWWFAHNDYQWRYISIKLCEAYWVADWDIRIAEEYYNENYKEVVEKIWKTAMEIAKEIHIV